MAKVYKIRLNSGDMFGLQSKEKRQELLAKGIEYSQLAIDAWKAAVDHTSSVIMASLPAQIRDAIPIIRKTLPQLRDDARCTRCAGAGYRDDYEEWIELKKGKTCFKCMGSGIETSMEPVFFRRRIIDTLRNTNEIKARGWAEKVIKDKQNPYRPVMLDIARTILQGDFKEVFNLPH